MRFLMPYSRPGERSREQNIETTSLPFFYFFFLFLMRQQYNAAV